MCSGICRDGIKRVGVFVLFFFFREEEKRVVRDVEGYKNV